MRLILALSAVVLVSGCTVPPPAAPAPAPATKEARPPLCDSPEPPARDPFPYNKDTARRDSILEISEPSTGGIASFEELDVTGLATLIEEDFADPRDRQNAAPPIWDFLLFLCEHPETRAMGYAVDAKRPDYRMSLETIYADTIDAKLKSHAEKFCADADESTFDTHLECFWD